jgi:uncharacterized membrane protein
MESEAVAPSLSSYQRQFTNTPPSMYSPPPMRDSNNSVMATLSMFVLFCVVYATVEFFYFSRPGTVSRYKHNFSRVQNIPIKDVKFRMWPYGVVSYVILFGVVWYFLVADIVSSADCCGGGKGRKTLQTVYDVLARATILALAIYGIYNLTNAATLQHYEYDIVILDTLWGVFAINVVAFIMWGLCVAVNAASSIPSFSFKRLFSGNSN